MKQFTKESQLLRHLAIGQHLYDKEEDDTTVDKARRMWAERCSSLCHNQPNLTADTVNIDDGQFVENVGYVLKKQRKNTRFPVKVKEYLNKLFEIGEISGKKASPYTVAKQMRYERDEAGKRCFAPSEWLSHQQIRGYFAGLSVKKQKERNTVKPSGKRLKLDEAVDDEDLQSAISAIVALEHSEAVSTVTTEVQESDD